MIVMAIDPGDSTGIAFVDTNLKVLGQSGWAYRCYSQTVGWSDLLNTQGTNPDTDQILQRLMLEKLPEYIVIERLPRDLTPRMRSVFELCLQTANGYIHRAYGENQGADVSRVHLVLPGQWKPLRKLFPMPPKNYPPYEYTQHEQDAYRMACFFIRKQKLAESS